MGILPRLSILVALAGGLALWAQHVHARYLPDAETLPGLRIDGQPVSGPVRAFAAARADLLAARMVHVTSDKGDDLGLHRLSELGVVVDVDAVVERAKRIGHEGDLTARASEAERAARGAVDVPLAFHLDTAPFVSLVARYKEALDVAPASARLDLEHHGVLPEHPGRYLDAFGAIAAFEHVADGGDASRDLIVPFAEVSPRVTSDFVSKLDVGVVLGSFETWFSRSGDQKRRGQNIDLGASKLDGVVLMPGEIVSFNAIVGDRSEDNGFQKSWEIYKGEMVEGVGGGTCQVASTLHAAAFFAGLDVLERLPHSRPSAYIPMGLDATVVYPIVDLKLRNPHAFPVVVHAKTDGSKLTIQLLGAGHPAKVTFSRELVDTKAWPRKVEEEPRLTGNQVLVKQHGIRGYRIKRTRVLVFEDGRRKVESNVDVYPPTTEVYAVPPGFDEAKLPPLPSDDDDAKAAPPPSDVIAALAAKRAATASADPSTVASVKYVDAPGAHAPTDAQKTPEKSLTLTR
jgi:vancomycin resistance protein YoaR